MQIDMATHTFIASLDTTGTVTWVPGRPQDDTTIRVGDTVVFRSFGGSIVLRFDAKTPFIASNSPGRSSTPPAQATLH